MSSQSGGRNALVTGGCGFSASYLIEDLLREGWKVRVTDLERASRKNIEKYGNQIEFIAADITDRNSLKPTIKDIDTVFHTAAIFDFTTPIEVLRKVNVEGTKNVIEESIAAGVDKVVSWSSVALYGTADPKHYKIPITEDQPLNPRCRGRYDTSKREQEAAALKYFSENGYPITFLRCGALYGPRSYYGAYALFKHIKEGCLNAIPKNLHKGSFPLAHAADISLAGIYLSDVKNYNGEAYNIVDNNNIDLVQTLKFVGTLVGSKIQAMIPLPLKIFRPVLNFFAKISLWNANHFRKKIDGKPPVPRLETDMLEYVYGNYFFSNQKLKETGYKLKYGDRRIGLIETIQWIEENGWEEPHH